MDRFVLVTSRSFGSTSTQPFSLLEQAEAEVQMMGSDFSQQAFEKAVVEADALIIGGHPFHEDTLRNCRNLQIICKHGVGLDNVPLATAREMGIHVTNAPGTNSNAVADLAFGLVLASARGIVHSVNALKAGIGKAVIGTDVCDKTLGLLGFGAIAREMALRAHGFRMRVLACDPYVTQDKLDKEFEFVTLCDRDQIITESDFISLHLPLTPETRNLVDAQFIAGMKPTAYLINTARGGIVDEDALYEAVKGGTIAGAALDVVEHEPLKQDCPLFTLDKVIVTGHIGMYSLEALNAVSMICARNVAAQFTGKPLLHEVVL